MLQSGFCTVCSSPGSSLRCSNCLGILYCNQICQKKDWKKHKVICEEARKAMENFSRQAGINNVEEVDEKLKDIIRLSKLGDKDAQYNLGTAYAKGMGVPIDKAKALKLWVLAARKGHVLAQCNAGIAYQYGHGVDIDLVESIKWYKRAADQGLPSAQFIIGSMYLNFENKLINKSEGFRWIELAANNGFSDAIDFLKKEKEKDKFSMWFCAAEHGDVNARYNLGKAFSTGDGVPIDKVQAVKWYRLAAEQGHPAAQYSLGFAYLQGDGVSIGKAVGLTWIHRAAENGLPEAKKFVASVNATLLDASRSFLHVPRQNEDTNSIPGTSTSSFVPFTHETVNSLPKTNPETPSPNVSIVASDKVEVNSDTLPITSSDTPASLSSCTTVPLSSSNTVPETPSSITTSESFNNDKSPTLTMIEVNDKSPTLGCCLILFGVIWFVFQAFILIGSKFFVGVPNFESIITDTDNISVSSSSPASFKHLLVVYLDALAKDFHYSTFSVLSIATVFVWVYLNWLCFKFFIHN